MCASKYAPHPVLCGMYLLASECVEGCMAAQRVKNNQFRGGLLVSTSSRQCLLQLQAWYCMATSKKMAAVAVMTYFNREFFFVNEYLPDINLKLSDRERKKGNLTPISASKF